MHSRIINSVLAFTYFIAEVLPPNLHTSCDKIALDVAQCPGGKLLPSREHYPFMDPKVE